jgi:hypothetical protein
MTDQTGTPTFNPALGWMYVFMLVLLFEGWALGTNHTAWTLSYQARAIRFDLVGRFIMWPLWCWLTIHFMFAPYWMGTQADGWRGVLAILVGLVIATLEIILHKH